MSEMRLPEGSYRLEAQKLGYAFSGSREEEPYNLAPTQDQSTPPGFILDNDGD
jgi:hypothetical protein